MLRLRAQANHYFFTIQRLQERLTSEAATLVLLVIASLSVLLYWWGFSRPYPLLTLYDQPLLDLYKLSKKAPEARWLLLLAFLGLGALYWLGWRAAQRAQGLWAWLAVMGGAGASSAILFFMYPFDAADIFDNIIHGRVLGIYGANPFVTPPKTFPDDPFLAYVAWKRSPSAYGPGWEALAGLAAWLAGNDILANVLVFKLLCAFFFAASAAVVVLILRQVAPERALAGLVLLTWNPIILYETLGNGHNDIAMVFWILAAIWASLRQRHTTAILLLIIGALFKFIPLLMLPAAGLIALRDLPNWRRRGRFVLVTGLLTMALILLAYLPFWQGVHVLTIERRMHLFTTSLPAMFYEALIPVIGTNRAGQGISLVAAGLTSCYALWQGFTAMRNRAWLSFTQAAFNILMFYLLLTCLWFQQWYALWPLGLAAILPPGHAARLAALFGYTALSKQLIFEPLFLWIRPLPPRLWRELRLGPAVLAVPWLYVILAWWFGRQEQRAEAGRQKSVNIDNDPIT